MAKTEASTTTVHSTSRDRQSCLLTARGHTRRRFLGGAALVAAGVSTAAAMPSVSRAAAQPAASPMPGNCPSVNVPMRNVEGKVAFITGGSSGVGLGIARAFADAGMKVAIGYRTEKHRDEAMQSLRTATERVCAIDVDVTDRPGMERAAQEVVKAFGKVHVLVNNAGVVNHEPLRSATYEDWDWQMSVNLNGVFNGIHVFLPHILAHGEGGQIIATSSLLGLITTANAAIYSATKYAVVGLMEALRAELMDENVGISVFCPGAVGSNIADADRNRPVDLAQTGVRPDPQARERERKFRHDLEYMLDPLEAGRLVLRGLRHNDLYILSHPEFEEIMRSRSEALIASIPRDLRPTEQRLQAAHSWAERSIYSIENDRLRCTKRWS